MTIEDIRKYAKEKGIPEKRVEVLIAELHPDENGNLNPVEALQAFNTIDYSVAVRENTRDILNAVRESRKQSNK